MSEEYDYESYEKGLKIVIDLAEKDYWNQYTNINAYQVSVAKTYLWISAALLGAFVAAYDRYSTFILSSGFTLLLALISIITVVLAFGICIYAIPARKGYKSIPKVSWGEFSQINHNYLCEKKSNSYAYLLSNIVDRLDAATHYNIQTNQERARLLRITSWVLIVSFSCSAVTAMTASLNHYIELNSTQIVEVSMMNQKSNSADNQSQPASGPDVPTPAGPISADSTTKPDGKVLNTSSEDSRQRRMTDSKGTESGSSE
ncbi:hypothetical protein [Vibrio parahaemolyticus]|uniref:hypothetical protein n=1 Tax=Vibrio parahaemolyticus TaxID=670 RepID=UPI0007A021EE|nr:hypothetical protein [Vibrio parahaemolyticus]KYZ08716.1 hypothetical protein AW033_22260 [Vibrio parahaemolyticus]